VKCRRPKCPNKARRAGLCAKHHKSGGFVDAAPAVAHYQALRAAGLTTHDIARLSGLNRDTLRGMGRHGCGRVRHSTLECLLAVSVPLRIAETGAKVDATGTRRRLQALQAAGYSLSALGAALGVSEQAVSLWLRRDVVEAATAAKVSALFGCWQLRPGPSARAAGYARRKGWAPPLAWDEDTIDDPAAKPYACARKDRLIIPRAELVEEVEFFGDVREVARRLGIQQESVEQQLRRSA